MAREEHDREDLLAEATALVERASLRLAGDAEETVAGFRRDGSLSIYFGTQPVYQFTSTGQLRRAFAGGEMLKADGGVLVTMHRERTDGAVHLVSRPLDEESTRVFRAEMQARLQRLQSCLLDGEYKLLGQVPAAGDVPGRVREWLERFAGEITIAASPRAR